jgi:hypothetical protein
MTSAALNMFDDCNIFHLFNSKKETGTNKISALKSMSLFEALLSKDIVLMTEQTIDQIPETIKEIENTEFSLKDCKSNLKKFTNAYNMTNDLISFINKFEMDEPIISQLLKNLEIICNKIVEIVEKFEDYISVIQARKEIENGDLLTFDEVFCV